jgi:hypothetical protein
MAASTMAARVASAYSSRRLLTAIPLDHIFTYYEYLSN